DRAREDRALEEELGEPRRREHRVGPAGAAVLALELLRPLERDLAQDARPVGRAERRPIQRGDDVAARREAEHFAHHVVGDLLRRDELHEAERSERLELGEAEPAVLPCVEVDALQVAVERAMRVRRRFTERIPERNRADGVATRDGTAAALDLAVADRLPTDGGRGPDLLVGTPSR